MPRRKAQSRSAALPHSRQKHSRTRLHGTDRPASMATIGSRKDDRKTAHHRHRNHERDKHTLAISARCGTRLPVAWARIRDAFGRRKSAHQIGYADWVTASKCTLHSRRAEHRTASARQSAAHHIAKKPARHGQFGDCGRTRRRDDAFGRLHCGSWSARWPTWRQCGFRRHTRRNAAMRHTHIALPERHATHRNSRHTPSWQRAMAHAAWCARQQSEKYRPQSATWHTHLHHGRVGFGQIDTDKPHAAAHFESAFLSLDRKTAALRQHRRHRKHRQSGEGGSSANRSHAAVESRHIHQHFHRHSQPVCRSHRIENARLQGGTILVQHRWRPLRSVQRQRLQNTRNELLARCAGAVRSLPRQTLQPRNARGAIQGQIHCRCARHDHQSSSRILRKYADIRLQTESFARCRAGLHQTWAIEHHAVGRRKSAHKTSCRTIETRHRAHALSARRTNHRTAFRGHSRAAWCAE